MAVKTLWIIVKRGKNTGIVVVIICYQPSSQQDAEDEGWQPEDFCCLWKASSAQGISTIQTSTKSTQCSASKPGRFCAVLMTIS